LMRRLCSRQLTGRARLHGIAAASPLQWRYVSSRGGPQITDIGAAAVRATEVVETVQAVDAEAIRTLVRDPRMVTLEIHVEKRSATLRQREVSIQVPLDEFREKLRSWGWEAENCHRPVLLFGDDDQQVQRAHRSLVEEGFTAVSNAGSREAVVASLKKPPAFLREPSE
ncbi:unnamed protein product, partial [Polarella glacialis]